MYIFFAEKNSPNEREKVINLLSKCNRKKVKVQELVKFGKKHMTEKTQERIMNCGNWLEFKADEEIKKIKLNRAIFCENRFCPMCAWRRAVKDALKIGVMMEYIEAEHGKAYIMVTLTAPNVGADELREEITRYNKAFHDLLKRDEIKNMNQGHVRKLEITHNRDRNDYHPHFHCIFAVNKSYFKSRAYISQEKWLRLWREAMRDESITQVDVRKVKNEIENAKGEVIKGKAVNEVSKYAAKDADYLHSQEVFDAMYEGLKGKIIITYGGLFKDAHKKYKDNELDAYIASDETVYKYYIMYLWGKEDQEYIEKSRKEITEADILAENWRYGK